jgi:Family of unknown function (DUF6281)
MHDRDADVDATIRRMLEAYQGPPEPRERRGPSRLRPWLRRPRVVLVAVVAVVVLVPLFASFLSADGEGDGNSGCAALLRFQGVEYRGDSIGDRRLSLQDSLGSAVVPSCTDAVIEDQDAGTTTVLGSPGGTVEVFSLQGIDPSVAIAREDEPTAVYVAAGRCVAYTGWSDFEACLREPVVFAGTAYVGTRLIEVGESSGLALGETLGLGERDSRRVSVAALEGVSQAAAIAIEGSNATYIALDRCFFSDPEALVECLKREGSD